MTQKKVTQKEQIVALKAEVERLLKLEVEYSGKLANFTLHEQVVRDLKESIDDKDAQIVKLRRAIAIKDIVGPTIADHYMQLYIRALEEKAELEADAGCKNFFILVSMLAFAAVMLRLFNII